MPQVLVIVTTDPRRSPRPAEAVRIAAGIAAGQRVDVALYFRGEAVLALSEINDDLVDADNFSRYLPMARDWNLPVYVERGAPSLKDLGQPLRSMEEISDAELARIATASEYVLRF